MLKQKLYPTFQTLNKIIDSRVKIFSAICYTGLVRPNLEYCMHSIVVLHKWFYQKGHFKNWKSLLEWKSSILIALKLTQGKFIKFIYFAKRSHQLYMLSFIKLIENLTPTIDQSLIPERLKTDTRLGRSEGLKTIQGQIQLHPCKLWCQIV